MMLLHLLLACAGDSPDPGPADTDTDGPQLTDTDPGTTDTDPGTTDTDTGTTDTGTDACAPAEVALSGVPPAATVTLSPKLCVCSLVAVAQGLPGLVLTYNEGVGYGQADAVDGWSMQGITGTPEATLFPGGTTASGLSYDASYRFALQHSGGAQAEVVARIASDRRALLDEMSWVSGCP